MVELMCNETFEDKDTNEAMEYLDLLAENAQNWDTIDTYEEILKKHCMHSSKSRRQSTLNLLKA